MSVTLQNLTYMALRLANVTKLPGATPSTDQLADCLQQAQLIIDQAQLKPALIYAERFTDYVLGTAEKYTLGPGGTLISTTSTSIRPIKIDRAKLILASTGTPVYLEVHNGTWEEFASLAIQQIPGALPKFLYCDYAYPTANVYLVPQDQGGDTLELYDRVPLQNFVAMSDVVVFPPGYQDWFVNGLAIRLAAVFKGQGAEVSEDTKEEFRRAARAIGMNNARAPRLVSDAPRSPSSGGITFNYYDGMPGK
jgi:hypothetical protein